MDIVTAFQSTPHALTLAKGNDPAILAAFAGRTFRRPDTGVEYNYFQRDGKLILKTPAYGRELPIDWVIGSGTHARTPLIVSDDHLHGLSGIEHSVSWYPPNQLGVTLGLETVRDKVGILALGRPRPAAETINCLGCHCTYLPIESSEIVGDHIEPGVGCARCHWDTVQHVAEMDAGRPSTIERFRALSPLESVQRCGECHRRVEEVGIDLDPEDPTLARFASVGLVQSPCFLQQGEIRNDRGESVRFDCTSCHDPHRPTIRDWRHHVRSCLTCHNANQGKAVDCPKATRDENCLTCHMPSVSANENLHFTDHWIRRPKVASTE